MKKNVWWDDNVHLPKFFAAVIVMGIAGSFLLFLIDRLLEVKVSGYLVGGVSAGIGVPLAAILSRK